MSATYSEFLASKVAFEDGVKYLQAQDRESSMPSLFDLESEAS